MPVPAEWWPRPRTEPSRFDFRDAPEAVEARSTNGSVTVRMPAAGLAYLVDARTTNGNVDTGSVPSDPSARRTVIAQTTNGDVTVTTG